jgi:hypothetical protein
VRCSIYSHRQVLVSSSMVLASDLGSVGKSARSLSVQGSSTVPAIGSSRRHIGTRLIGLGWQYGASNRFGFRRQIGTELISSVRIYISTRSY